MGRKESMPCPETVARTEAAKRNSIPLPNRASQLRTAQGIDEACKTVLQQPD